MFHPPWPSSGHTSFSVLSLLVVSAILTAPLLGVELAVLPYRVLGMVFTAGPTRLSTISKVSSRSKVTNSFELMPSHCCYSYREDERGCVPGLHNRTSYSPSHSTWHPKSTDALWAHKTFRSIMNAQLMSRCHPRISSVNISIKRGGVSPDRQDVCPGQFPLSV
jgi:hypothetical protein